jgi:low affinity Fe/Cu permease
MSKSIKSRFDLFSKWISDALGKPLTFVIALGLVVTWAAFGPWTHYSQTWQLIINTGTTISTFLMVFLLQHTQNRNDRENRESLQRLVDQQRLVLESQRRLAERIRFLEFDIRKNKG